MAIELFKPFVMKRLVQDGRAQNIKAAKRLVERSTDEVWDILEEVIKDHPVLLNRAPTLHRLGIQAFEPILVEGHAIKLHPLVCTAYNADFDGDQMAVHVPLSAEAQAEARFLMLSSNNLLKPQDGKPVTVPTQDMVLGIYYMTSERENQPGDGRAFSSLAEAEMAYNENEINLHSRIKVRMTDQFNGQTMSQMVESTFGRMLFNEILPQNLGFVNRSIPGNELQLEVDTLVDKKKLGQIIEKCININGISETARVLDQIKAMGYHASTRSGISIGVFDMIVPDVKKSYIQEAEATVDRIHNMYLRGLLNDEGRKAATIKVWRKTTDDITEALKESLPADNPIFMMSDSGARGSMNQIKQLAGMRGNMAATSGEIIEIPIKSNLREGMNVLEFFISSHGARKALSDTALKTADSGYLTRRLVDVAQDVIIHGDECGTDEYIEVAALMTGSGAGKRVLKPLHDRIIGRNAALDVVHPESGEIIVKANWMITGKIAEAIEAAGITKVAIRSVLTCQARQPSAPVATAESGLGSAHGAGRSRRRHGRPVHR